jgi:hypothetical protein
VVRATRVLVGIAVALVLACAGLSAVLPVQRAAAAVANTRLAIAPVFSATLVGGYDQAGNGLLDCAALTNGSALPAGGCVRDIHTALTDPGNLPFYNNQVLQKDLDRDSNPATSTSSSATVQIPPGVGWCSPS